LLNERDWHRFVRIAASVFREKRVELNSMKQWQCVVCGFIYDEAKGLPEEGIAPGTKWEDIPEDWECPECGVGKDDFEMVEI
jgi:rubredoxin